MMADKKWDIKRGYSVYKSVYTPIVKKWIREGRINEGEVLVWTSCMSGWRSPEELDEFKSIFNIKKRKKKPAASIQIREGEKREKPKVLIIDDEKDICWLLEKYLRKRHFNVLSVDTGRGGIEMVKQKEPDVVLLDLKLEDINGLNVLRRIKEFSKKIKVIIVSAFAYSEIKENAVRIGADGFVDKPFKPEEIKAIKEV